MEYPTVHVVLLTMLAQELSRLIDCHAGALMLYARQWCAVPEDVVQEAFIKLVQQRTLPEDVLAWLYRVVRNRAMDAGKTSRRRQALARFENVYRLLNNWSLRKPLCAAISSRRCRADCGRCGGAIGKGSGEKSATMKAQIWRAFWRHLCLRAPIHG